MLGRRTYPIDQRSSTQAVTPPVAACRQEVGVMVRWRLANWRDWTRFNRRRVLMVAGLVVLAPAVAAAQGSQGAEQFVSGLTEQAIDLSRQVAANPTAHTVELPSCSTSPPTSSWSGGWCSGSSGVRSGRRSVRSISGRPGLRVGRAAAAAGGTKGVERVEVTGSRLVRGEDSMVSTRIALGAGGRRPTSNGGCGRETPATGSSTSWPRA